MDGLPYLDLNCPKCNGHLARLYGGTRIVISFRCVKCKAISVLRIDEALVVAIPRPETRQKQGDGNAPLRIHPLRMAGN